jgi:hypothetical protein
MNCVFICSRLCFQAKLQFIQNVTLSITNTNGVLISLSLVLIVFVVLVLVIFVSL